MNNIEYNLSLFYLTHVATVVFCTISSAAHDLIIQAGPWDEITIDEAAHDTLTGLATILGAHANRTRHITFAGDHKQMRGVCLSRDSNVGFRALNRDLFLEKAIEAETLAAVGRSNDSDAFILTTCYRMPPSLIDWSSRYCYDRKVTAARDENDLSLLEGSLKLYWSQRVREGQEVNFHRIALDCTIKGVKDEFSAGTSSRVNVHEARVIASTIKDMLLWNPPSDHYKLKGSNFLVVVNYRAQQLVIARDLKQQYPGQDPISWAELNDVRVLTTNSAGSKEAPIVFYGTTLAPGFERLPSDMHLPTGFIANNNNFNVSITRQQSGRYIVGAIRLFAHMQITRHNARGKNHAFFQFMKELVEEDCVLLPGDITAWQTSRAKPTVTPEEAAKARELMKFTFSSQS